MYLLSSTYVTQKSENYEMSLKCLSTSTGHISQFRMCRASLKPPTFLIDITVGKFDDF